MRPHSFLLACAAGAATWSVLPAGRATYPERSVRLIVPFPPGGMNDIASRIVANGLGGFRRRQRRATWWRSSSIAWQRYDLARHMRAHRNRALEQGDLRRRR